jgi:hypothetical protein
MADRLLASGAGSACLCCGDLREACTCIMEHETRYLNVDLEISGRRNLQPLVDALAPQAFALHAGFHAGRHRAALELSGVARMNADATIQRLAALVKALPRPARQLWNAAERRDFNIGIQAGREPYSFECPIGNGALRAAAAVGARVVITVYGSGIDARAATAKRRPRRPARVERGRLTP